MLLLTLLWLLTDGKIPMCLKAVISISFLDNRTNSTANVNTVVDDSKTNSMANVNTVADDNEINSTMSTLQLKATYSTPWPVSTRWLAAARSTLWSTRWLTATRSNTTGSTVSIWWLIVLTSVTPRQVIKGWLTIRQIQRRVPCESVQFCRRNGIICIQYIVQSLTAAGDDDRSNFPGCRARRGKEEVNLLVKIHFQRVI